VIVPVEGGMSCREDISSQDRHASLRRNTWYGSVGCAAAFDHAAEAHSDHLDVAPSRALCTEHERLPTEFMGRCLPIALLLEVLLRR
jgi:hypothetical protein